MIPQADHSQSEQIAKRLKQSSKKLTELAPMLGMAKTVRAYDSDRRKQAFSVEVVKAYKDGAESTAEAEHKARASDAYKQQLSLLQTELETAEKIISENDATQCMWDTARSLLAMSRETLRNLPE